MDGFDSLLGHQMTYTLYTPDQRDSFGQYSISAGATHVFPFNVPMLGCLKISTAHIFPNSQDFSIDMWVTSQPLDGIAMYYGINHTKASRRTTEYLVYDQLLMTDETDERLFLASNQTFYVNVKNLQNRINAYELTFDIVTLTP